jgi:two-component system, sensor histidine kinase ChiS
MKLIIGFVLTVLLLPFLCGNSFAQQRNISFERLSVSQGLSQGSIKCMLQDHLGFLWVGTEDGLNRYDGYGFKVFRHDPQDPNSLSNNTIKVLFEDRDGALWIGTTRGLNRYNRQTDNFTVYRNDPGSPAGLSKDIVYSIYQGRDRTLWINTGELNRYNPETDSFTVYNIPKSTADPKVGGVVAIHQDRSGKYWVSTWGTGLYRFNPQTGSFFSYRNDPLSATTISSDKIGQILEDSRGTLWFGTKRGLNRYDPKTDSFVAYLYDPKLPADGTEQIQVIYEDSRGTLWFGTIKGSLYRYNPRTDSLTTYLLHNSVQSNVPVGTGEITAIYEDRAGTLWFSTVGNGIYIYDQKNDSLINYRNRPHSTKSLSNDQITTIYEDRSGIVWFGTYGGGLNKYDRQTQKFILYQKDPNEPNSLSDNSINTICEDSNGILWVGTRADGLNRYDPKTGEFTVYRHDPKNPNSISSNIISAIYEDSKARLWIGTGNGLNRYDPKSNSFISYRDASEARFGRTLRTNYIHAICEDRDGSILIGYAGGDGLYRYYPETDSSIFYQCCNKSGDISATDVYSIYVDRGGTLWAGTYDQGLNRYDPATNSFIVYRHDPKNPASLSDNRVTAIYEDRANTLWVGTTGGLNRYNSLEQNFTSFFERDGLPNSSINGMLEDREGNLWLSTNKGLSKFNPRSVKFINYDEDDGLQGNEFYYPAYYRSRSGEMFFGGSNGFNRFFPEKIKENPFVAPVLITSFKVFDQPVERALSILAESAERRQEGELMLSYKENFFSFEFATLNFTIPEKNQYAYRLEGFDQNWVMCGTRRYASYTNLSPGNYIFRIKGSNNDGVWNEQVASVRIKIMPPPWRSWWAYLLYGISFTGAAYGLVRVRRRRAQIQESLRDIQMRADAAEIANRAKSTFLANMSHELRTPLNAILGFSQIIARDRSLKQEIREHLDTIIRSGEHLLGLINDVLSITKIEAGKLSLKEQSFNIHYLLHDLTSIFQTRAGTKGVEFSCEIDNSLPENVRGDDGKLRQILINLLGNAVKFTDSGKIVLRARWKDDRVFIEVEDTGYGMLEEETESLFEPFMQTESGYKSKEGAGLGLSISRKMARLMGGDITVESELGEGTLFRLEIDLPATSEIQLQSQKSIVTGLLPGQKEYRILVVDDRWENRAVLIKLLGSIGFDMREATNGKEAIEIWREWKPDLIWMDMRMKVMDGYTATELIRRESSKTNGSDKVVIIALTASAFEQDHRKILAAGCDDIVTKPYLESTIFKKLEEHLGIGFQYEDRASVISGAGAAVINLDLVLRLRAIPVDLLDQLRRAILQSGTDVTLQVINEIGKLDEPLAVELRQMVKGFRLHEIIVLMERR